MNRQRGHTAADPTLNIVLTTLDLRHALELKKAMQRIVVIGGMGAGKSIFSERLSKAIGLKLYHLDRLFWKSGTNGVGRQEWLRMQEEIVAGASWIVEGNYGATIDVRLKKADTVIFLDFSRLSCFLGVIKRTLLSKIGVKKRAGIVAGCNERLDARFLGYVWNFNKKHRKGILRGLSRYPDIELIVLKRRREAELFLRDIESSGVFEPGGGPIWK
jgi:adenylate kinase family enzyme